MLFAVLASAVIILPAHAQDALPVTRSHHHGHTMIEQAPERIATIGWMSQDVVLALGQVAVSIPLQQWGDANGMLLCVATAVVELGGELPTRYGDTAIRFEDILALEIDLNLAPYSGFTEPKYNRLSQIAPTVAWTGAEWLGIWQDITRTVGKAPGRSARAEEMVEQTPARLEVIAADHPEFAAKTLTVGWGDPSKSSLGVHVGTDPHVHVIEDLGLRSGDVTRAVGNDIFYVDGSFETPAAYDANVLITWQSDQAELDALRANPVFAGLDQSRTATTSPSSTGTS